MSSEDCFDSPRSDTDSKALDRSSEKEESSSKSATDWKSNGTKQPSLRTRNSSSSGSYKQSRMSSKSSSRSQSPRLNSSLSLDAATGKGAKFEFPAQSDSAVLSVEQENFSSSVYGGLNQHGVSRLSETSSLNSADLRSAAAFNDKSQKSEDRNSSGELYGTPSSQKSDSVLTSTNAVSSTTTTPSTSGLASQSTSNLRKKKSWISTLYPTYKSRSSEFKKLFPNLPPEERLIVDFSCALQKDILVHGRLYCTMNYLCFYANIFRCKTLLSVRWDDVLAVTKEKMALIFPNAIEVVTETEKYFFTSFAARDKTHTVLMKLWQISKQQLPALTADIWLWVHSFYGDELGLTSDDEPDYVSPYSSTGPSGIPILGAEDSPQFIHSRRRMSKSATSPASLNESFFEQTGNSSRSNTSSETGGLKSLKPIEESGGCQDVAGKRDNRSRPDSLVVSSAESNRQSRCRLIDTNNLSVSDLSDMSTESENEFSQPRESEDGIVKSESGRRKRPWVTLETWRARQEGREMASQSFSIDVDTLFTLLFTDSDFFNEFHSSRKTFDIVLSQWGPKDDGTNDKYRDVSFTVSLNNSMGYKQAQVNETQVLSSESYPGEIYVVNVDSMNAGIPYADSFYVALSFCLTRVDDQNSHLSVYANIKYKKAVWGLVKTFIEKNSWSGLEEFYGSLCKSLEAFCANDVTQNVKSKKMKKRSRDVARGQQPDVLEVGQDLGGGQGFNVKRGRPSVASSNLNGGLLGDFGSRPSSAEHSTSYLETSPFNGALVKIILFLLTTLLLANTLLFFRLYNLESRLIETDHKSEERLDPSLYMIRDEFPQTQEEWIHLVQKQEMLHEIELEKWHQLLGAATQLLRQTEESLSDLQKTIHPLALKKLRQHFYSQNIEKIQDDQASTPVLHTKGLSENRVTTKSPNLSKHEGSRLEL